MIIKLQNILRPYEADFAGIYDAFFAGDALDQATELALRECVAMEKYDDYLAAIARSHSIPVMDHEVDCFLRSIPHGSVILDVGGCWGWHWRRLANTRPDVGVLIIDFVRANLTHAQKVLGDLVGTQVALMYANATALPFHMGTDFQGFDGVWTVQTFQHIPTFEKAVAEAHRVLKRGGVFANYSLNAQPPIRWIYRLLGKKYITADWVPGMYWLASASRKQKQQIEAIFGSRVTERWSEILYSPELRFPMPGRESSWLGRIDARLSNNVGLLGWLARQRSFHCSKS